MKQEGKIKQHGHNAGKGKAREASSSTTSTATTAKKKLSIPHVTPTPSSTAAHKLTKQQVAELLKVFWAELLQNNVRQVKKMLVAKLHSVDFRTAKYAPAADGSALHLCAQHGFLAMAQLLVDMKVVDLNAQSKVGSTPLHIACKFGQEAMLLFLLELGARVDVPDSQNRIAFDVAPFAVVDRCILAPLREQLRAAQEENDELREQDASAIAAVEEAQRECYNAEMALADAESWAFAERELLSTTRATDNEWNERVQRERGVLEHHRAVYREHLDVLDDTRERIESARGHLIAAVERDKKATQEETNQLKLRVHQVEQALEAEQQELNDQLGLVDAANALPNDPDVQEWVLSVMLTMIEEDERCPSAVNGMTRSVRLLAREEVVMVISNVLVRFPNTRHLQRCALQCLLALVSHVEAVIETHCTSIDERRSLLLLVDGLAVMKTKKSNVLTLCRDALVRFSTDVDMNAVVAAMYYRLLRPLPPSDGSSRAPLASVRFSYESRNQKLPLDMLLLYEQARRLGTVCWTDDAWIEAVRDAAFLLFTVTRSNATKTLLASNAISTANFWICELATMGQSTAAGMRSIDEVKPAAMRYLLGALSFLHSVPLFSTANAAVVMTSGLTSSSSPRPLEEVHPWTANDVHALLSAVSSALPTTDKQKRDPDDNAGIRGRQHRMLVGFWTLKLLRNLALHSGEAARAVRVELFEPEVFSLLARTATALLHFTAEWNRQSQDDNDSNSRDDRHAFDVPDRSAIVGVWMDLAEVVWIRHYDTDGKLRTTAEFAMEHVLALVSWQMKRLGDLYRRDVTLAACSRMLSTVALVLVNGKNARFLRKSAAVLDVAVRAFLRWMLTLCDINTGDLTVDVDGNDSGVSSATVFEALAHVLHIYLATLSDQLASNAIDEGENRIAVQQLHDRCHAVGICAVLRAFHVLDDDQGYSSECQEEVRTSSPRVPGHVGSLKRMRAVGKAAGSPALLPHQTSDERRVLRALSRAVVDLVRCKC